MAIYNFKKQAKVYLVTREATPKRYTLEVTPELSFSQTFTDKPTKVKTLHDQNNFFERGSIKKANPANFEFTIPVFKEGDMQIVHDLALSCDTFDLYISTEQDVFKLEKAVITNGTYVIERLKPLSFTVSGQASKLSKVGVANSYSVPGNAQSVTENRTYLRVLELDIDLGSEDFSKEVLSLTAELQNDVEWTKNSTVQNGIESSSAANAVYPAAFTIGKKSFAGSLVRYLCDSNAALAQNFDPNISMRIKAGERVIGVLYGFDFNMPSVSFTSRVGSEELFTQSYDWRLTSNSSITSIINYINT